MSIVCIYHKNCADGFAAAWVVRRAYPDQHVEFVAAKYGDEPPYLQLYRNTVIIVDFSYPREQMEEIAKQATALVVLDHHKSAQENLRDFSAPGAEVVFDMERSGAGLAWRYFFPGETMPPLLGRIEDRDLWRFLYPDSREVNAALFSFPYDFDVWDKLMEDTGIPTLITEGHAILRKQQKDIDELLSQGKLYSRIADQVVPVANLPYTLASEAGHILAKGQPFAAIYWQAADGYRYSLRSDDNGMDVADVARIYRGGGHKHAAGFTVPTKFPTWSEE